MNSHFCLFVLGFLLFKAETLKVQRYFSDVSNYTRFRRHSDEGSCVLPPFPEHGEWKLLNGVAKPGDKVPKSTVIQYECSLRHKLSQNQYLVCNGKWSLPTFPECEALCPPLYSSSRVTVTCKDKRGKDIPCNEATDGTYLTYKCASFYETPFGYKKTLLCSDGTWNYPIMCHPVCGRTVNSKDAKPLIAGVKPNDKLEYPWVTAIYEKKNGTYENVCGGSIISLTIVLTAAHCVTNDYGDRLPEENYMVGAGKLFSEYQAPADTFAQYLELHKIEVPKDYKASSRHYSGDIAVLVTKGSFTLNEVVAPVCFNDLTSISLHAGNIGEVSGWGKTEEGLPSKILRTLKIPYKYETTCAQELPPQWADKYNSIDKICAGFVNQSVSVCSGDSGSGLVFKNPDDTRYYIHGLVSLGPTTKQGDCDIQQNSLYTKVAFYYEFIDRLLTKFSASVEDCVLPSYLQNGKWTIDKQDRKPGDIVPSNTLLKLKCNLGFKLSSTSNSIECGSARDMPTCQLLCPAIPFPKRTVFRCTNTEGKPINCLDAVHGSTLFYTCPKGYAFPEGTTGVRSCIMGSWGSPEPKCLPEQELTPQTDSPVNVTIPSTFPPVTASSEEEEGYAKVICVYMASRYYDSNVDPDDLDGSLCTHVIYSSVGLAADGSVNIQGNPIPAGGTKSLFVKVADMKAKNPKLKVLLRVEGLSDAEYSSMAGDQEKRSRFIYSVTSFIDMYKYDGLDVFWNVPLTKDTDNYGNLLREIRKAFEPKGWLLATSVYVIPTYIGYDVQAMNEAVDWVNIHNFDNYLGSSKYAGQFSAFKPSSKEGEWYMDFNMVTGAYVWKTRGLNKEKIALSIAFYGRYHTLKNPRYHDVKSDVIPGESGLLTYSEICQKYTTWKRVWDDEQKNPYKYSGNKWFGYDDLESIKIKAEYIEKEGFFGAHIHSIDADDVQGKCGPRQNLLKSVYNILR